MSNKLLGVLVFSILFIITLYKFNYITLGLMIIIFIFLIMNKQYFLIIINLLVSLIILLSSKINIKSEDVNFNNPFIVKEVYENYCIIHQNKNSYIIYQDDIELKEGNKLIIKGELKELSPSGIPYLFSFSEYLNNKNIYYQIDYEEIIISNDNTTFQTKIINNITNRISYSKKYLDLLIFNSKSDVISNLYNNLIKISAVQLFVISGFHISFLKQTLDKILSKITKKEEHNIVMVALLFYVYLLKFSLSSLRAFLSIIFNKINKHYKLNLTTLDINSLIAILFLIFNPKTLFLVGFQLSFFVVISICLISYIKTKINKILILVIPFLISLPIIINMNSQIGLINIFMNYLLTPLVSIIYLLGIVILIIPSLDKYLFYIIYGFELIIDKIGDFNIYLVFPYLNLGGIIIFYIIIYNIILYIYLKKNKNVYINLFLISIFMLGWYYKPFSNPYIIFLDVGQGDSCLIHGKNNEYNILIDTGGNLYSDIATKKLIPYFEKEGIRKLDLVIISHLDYDHYGALESLDNNFKINKIVKDNNYKNIYYENLHFKNLNQYFDENSEDENIKSSVLLFEFIGLNFLMCGDAPIEIEKEIIKNNKIDVDVVKIGHHGSNTSSSNEFIYHIKPEIGIISCGKNNRYGHPHINVINILKSNNVAIFRTDEDGSIKISKNLFNEVVISKRF